MSPNNNQIIIRRFTPSLIASELVDVQPMYIESAGIFQFVCKYKIAPWYKLFIEKVLQVTLCKLGLHPLQTYYLCYGFNGPAIVCDCCKKVLQ